MNFLKTKYTPSIVLLISCMIISPSLLADTEKYQIIRFYKLNKKQQQNRLVMKEKKLKLSGCHNFFLSPRVYRLTQIGFNYCSLYSEKNCKANTEITGLWKKKSKNMQFTEGGRWFFNQNSQYGIKAKSWYCE